MKHISTFLRTLFFTALLCMTSVSAMAYDLIQTDEEIEKLQTNGEHITVIGGNVRINSLCVDVGYAAIVLPGVGVEIINHGVLDNQGTIYIFGTMFVHYASNCNNSGTIYLVGGGQLTGTQEPIGNAPKEVEESEVLNKTIKYEGKPATEAEHGLKDYWEKGIEFNGDYCPIFYYEDEACTNKIDNIEKWKENGRIIYSLPLYKKEAIEAIDNEIEGMTILTEEDMREISGYKTMIDSSVTIAEIDKAKNDAFRFIRPIKVKDTALAAIRSAMQGETSAYLTKLVQTQIDIIYSSTEEQEIASAQNAAIEILNSVIDTYKTIKSEAVGTLGTKQNGPAVILTDKDSKEFIFYSPKSVEYIKVNEE